MSLTGNHIIGDPGHTSDHNLIDAAVTAVQANVSSLSSSVASKAASSHTHNEGDVTSLVGDLAGKAATSHTHAESDVTNLVADLAAAGSGGSAVVSYLDLANDEPSSTPDLVTGYAPGVYIPVDGLTVKFQVGTDITLGVDKKTITLHSAGVYLIGAVGYTSVVNSPTAMSIWLRMGTGASLSSPIWSGNTGYGLLDFQDWVTRQFGPALTTSLIIPAGAPALEFTVALQALGGAGVESQGFGAVTVTKLA